MALLFYNRAYNSAEFSKKRPLIIGVTGGMASGKSTLAQMMAGRGIVHVDADKIVHSLLRDDGGMIAEIAAAFPQAVIQNTLSRGALAAEIAKTPARLGLLEGIIHPRVRARELAIIAAARRKHVRALVLDIPLLFETDADQLCDVVIVAHAPLPHRRRRAFSRAGMTQQKWQSLLDRQLPDHHRCRAADIVISTGIGKAATRRALNRLMRRWGLV